MIFSLQSPLTKITRWTLLILGGVEQIKDHTHLTNPSEHAAKTKYNDWQLSFKFAALNDVKDINLISEKDWESCFLRLRRWLLKRNENSPRKTIGEDVILSPWRLSLMRDRSTRQHLSEARPPPEKRRWQVLSFVGWPFICSFGCMFGLGDLVVHKARTLDIWPWAVKIDEVTPVERSAEGERVKETIYERGYPKVSKFRHSQLHWNEADNVQFFDIFWHRDSLRWHLQKGKPICSKRQFL